MNDEIPGLVSVVIPSYNRAYIVGQAIESVLRQTYTNVEVVVIDDGSTDDTERVVAAFDERVRYIHQANAGIAVARNSGIAAARGEYVAFLDSDDAWLPWKLEAQMSVLRQRPEVGMVWTDMTAVDESGDIVEAEYLRTFYKASFRHTTLERICEPAGMLRSFFPAVPKAAASHPVYTGEIYSHMFMGNVVHTSTVVVRREWALRVGGFDLDMRPAGEDYDFHFRITRCGPVAFIDAPSILYRVNAQDQVTAPHVVVHIARGNLKTVMRTLKADGDSLELPRRLIGDRVAESFAWLGTELLKTGDRRDAASHLWRSLCLRPLQPTTAATLLFCFLPSGMLTIAARVRRKLRGHQPTLSPA